MSEKKPYRIMISGGGTGGHIYPAISIAQSLKEILAEVEILFVGAKGRMEMKRVPEAGFNIIGLWISGIQRRITLSNLVFPVKLLVSIYKSFQLLKKFKPDVVVGVGGFASGPLLWCSQQSSLPTLIQEQNSYAGLANKWLSKGANTICVAHEGMDKYFPANKLAVTGNPVRSSIKLAESQQKEAHSFFNFKEDKKTILILGGSLGARTINESVLAHIDRLIDSQIQVIWQTGSFYFDEMISRCSEKNLSDIRIVEFIKEMQYAYYLADVVISRAGALSLAELMLTAKPSILVPSPNVAEDHQTKNANALVERNAALMIKDNSAIDDLIPSTIELLNNSEKCKQLSEEILKMARPNAARDIANEIIKLIP